MTLSLSLACDETPRARPILDGKVRGDGFDFVATPLHPGEMFWRQLHYAEFDVSEMSMSSLMMTLAAGDKRFYGIPVFTTRQMFHTTTLVRKDAGIDKPEDLKGKRIGVPEYQQTAALWIRGALQHEWGVRAQDVEWHMERLPSRSHAGATGFKPSNGVTLKQIPAETSIGEMMIAGTLDAVIFYIRATPNNPLDRSRADLANHPEIKPLFPDRQAEGVRYFKKTGIYPINHGMVIRRDVADKNPGLARKVLEAFQRANDMAERERIELTEYHVELGKLGAGAREALATPLIRHGLAANRKTIEMAAQMSFEQGLTPRLMKLDEIFAPEVMDT
jgi:4,5-dihydroxyphthalate decarboxylase